MDKKEASLARLMLSQWNNKLYGNKFPAEEHTSDWFWDNFEIESWPKFPKRCAFHIPKVWGDAVKGMIEELRAKHPGIEFDQIKEKFCILTVYVALDNSRSDEENDSIRAIVEKYREQLRSEGLHPLKKQGVNEDGKE